MAQFLENSGIAVLVALLSFFYAYRIMVLKDISGIRKSFSKRLKDKDGYIKEAGLLFIIFGIIALIAAVVLNFSFLLGTVIVFAAIVYVSIMWKKINEKYEE